MLAAQLLAVHLQHARPDEPCLPEVHVDARATPVGDGALVHGVETPEDPFPDRRPVGTAGLGVDAVPARMPHRLRDVSGVDEHLGRDAAAVDARAPEEVALDDRDAEALEAVRRQHVAGAGAHDHEVVVRHPRRIRVLLASPTGLRDMCFNCRPRGVGSGFSCSSGGTMESAIKAPGIPASLRAGRLEPTRAPRRPRRDHGLARRSRRAAASCTRCTTSCVAVAPMYKNRPEIVPRRVDVHPLRRDRRDLPRTRASSTTRRSSTRRSTTATARSRA